MSRLLYIFPLLFIIGCCSTTSNFEDLDKVHHDMHRIKILHLSPEYGDYKLPRLVFQNLNKPKSQMGVKLYFEDSASANLHFKSIDTALFINNFDFDKFILVPFINVEEVGEDQSTSYQVYGLLDHRNKEVILTINQRQINCGYLTPSRHDSFVRWYVIPRPQGYEFILNDNT